MTMNQQNAQARTTCKDQIDNLTQVRKNPNPARQGARYRNQQSRRLSELKWGGTFLL